MIVDFTKIFSLILLVLPSLAMNINAPSLVDVLNYSCYPTDNDPSFDFLGTSHYYDDEAFNEFSVNNVNNFVILSMNCQSLRAKLDEMLLMLDAYNSVNGCDIAMICLQETWIARDSDVLIDIPNYNYVIKGHSTSSHGGVVTYIRSDLNFDIVTIPDHSENLWESLFLQVYGPATGGSKLIIGNIYRPPRERVDLIDRFLEEFNDTLESLDDYNYVYIFGDYNFDALKYRSETRIGNFLDQSFASGYFPKITQPTRIAEKSQTLIDNVLCKFSPNFHSLHAGILSHSISDHQPYFLAVSLPQYCRKNNPHPMYQYITNTNEQSKQLKKMLSNDLNLGDFDNDDPQQNFDKFHTIITKAQSLSFTRKRVRSDRRKIPKLPWITSGLVKSIKTRNKLYKKLKNTDPSLEKYRILKLQLRNFGKVLRNSIKIAKRNYYAKVFQHQKDDPRKMWATISSLTSGKKAASSLPESFIIDGKTVTDQQQIADEFNLYFLNIASKMTESLGPADSSFKSYLNKHHKSHKFKFRHVNEDEVSKCIDSLKNKRTLDCYGLSTEIVKLCKSELVPVLALLINQCIDRGIFPEQLKQARVTAIHKKGDKNVFENYRPISILPALSKIFERILHSQLSKYFTDNNLFYSSQYSFRQHHSTEFAALEFIDTVVNHLETRKPFISLYMDLSKAFDCLDHNILLEKLNYYGMDEKSRNLLKNYLTNRNQYLELKVDSSVSSQTSDGMHAKGQGLSSDNTIRSKLGEIRVGVPQGSILGPLLFIIFINDICKCSNFFSTILYADDSTFSTVIDKESPEISSTINKELQNVCSWLNANRLCLNVAKTKYMLFNRTQTNLELDIKINDTNLEQVKTFNFLGLTISDQLDWTSHVDKISKKLSRNIGILRRLRSQLPADIIKILYFSLIHSHLTYMILIWGHENNEILKKQKQALRIIHNKHYLSHTDPLFKSAKILKVSDLHTQAQLKFCRKFIDGRLPNYFMKLNLKKNSDNHGYDTIHKNSYVLPKPTSENSRKLLRNAIPSLMNNLPTSLYEALHSDHDYAIATTFKYETLNLYSDQLRCDPGVPCWPCSVVF